MPVKCLSSVGALLLLGAVAAAQLPAGNYTIDPSLPAGGNNFQTWAAASAALAAGVAGPGNLTFTVASTTFNEAVAFQTITGTSATTTVTFVAVGAPAVIDAGGQQDALTLNNDQSYLVFENLELRNFTRYGLYLNGVVQTSPLPTLRSTFCTFRRIVADAPASSSSTVSALRNFYAWDCDFEDCRFLGGGNVMNSQQISRNNFRRCEFDGKSLAARLLAPFNTNDADNLWENCFFHDCGPTANGLHIDLSSYGNMFWHNTVIVNTSGRAVFLGSLTSWSRANSFRNNIVVNLGSGVCMVYGFTTSGTPRLECNDLDHNIYFAPNGNAVELQNGSAAGFTVGSLAAWRTFFLANPQLIVAAGGTDWDTNSIEGDPQLVSMTAPYDIHLTPGSPARDAGTTLYVAGTWISYNQSYVVIDDFEGNLRPSTGVDIGADELGCAMPEYETNDAASSLDIDGVQGTICSPAVVLKTQGAPATLNFASTRVGFGWEAAVALAPLLPASGGAIQSANGQILNINLAAPVVFLNGGLFPSFANPFPGNFSLGFNAPFAPITASIQMVNIDPTHPDGISISQGSQLNVP